MNERAKQAHQLFLEGYNCAQAVCLSFQDKLQLPAPQLAAAAAGFGGGIGRMREVCGCVSGMVLAYNMLYGYEGPKDSAEKKAQLYQDIQQMCERFRAENGSLVCRELLGLSKSACENGCSSGCGRKRPCSELAACAADILDRQLAEKER